jgi:small conductance mechanosensitive channel
VTLSGISGLVESINLRRTVIRDLDGQVHVIPNGEITVASNKTKYWSRVNLDVGVAYKEDVNRVVEVLNDIGEEIAADPYYGLMLITPPQVLRLNSLDDSAVTFKMLGDCKPMKQWEIMGEMRKRIKIRLDAEGIEIPFPHQMVYWGEAQPPFRPDVAVQDSVQVARPAPSAPLPPETIGPVTPQPAIPDKSVDDVAMTPELREELLAALAIATSARVGDSDPDARTRMQLIDTIDSE